jgi:lipopolysaccharide assembly outer membrane protein LptD (OstA)
MPSLFRNYVPYYVPYYWRAKPKKRPDMDQMTLFEQLDAEVE